MTEPTAAEASQDGADAPLEHTTGEVVDRAIASVLEQVPSGDPRDPDAESGKLQPWAETAPPTGKNKRPLADLLAAYAERVAADPGSRAGRPSAKHPALVFLERFKPGWGGGRTGEERAPGGRADRDSGRRGRGRGRGRGRAPGVPITGTAVGGAPTPRPAGGAPGIAAPRPPRPRRRRGGRGGGGAANSSPPARPAGQSGEVTWPRRPQGAAPQAGPGGSPRPGGPRRRRGGRGRGPGAGGGQPRGGEPTG